MSRRRINLGMMFAAGTGLAIFIGLTIWSGWSAVAQAIADAGWGVLLVTLVRGFEIAGAGLAWWYLFPSPSDCRLSTALLLRWVREAVNQLLPVAQVGGELIGARLLTFYGVEGGLAGASVLVDLLVQTFTQLLFSLLGLALLALAGADRALLGGMAVGLAVMAIALAGFYLTQRKGGFLALERAMLRMAERNGWASLGQVASLHDRVQQIYGHKGRLIAASLVHLAVWLIGVLEVWIALRFMGHPVGLAESIVIESLGHAVRGVGFLVPGALGIQEGGFIALCAIYGIPAPVALALSLVKRVPEIVLGVPALGLWHAIESARLRHGADRQGGSGEATQ